MKKKKNLGTDPPQHAWLLSDFHVFVYVKEIEMKLKFGKPRIKNQLLKCIIAGESLSGCCVIIIFIL